MKQLLSLITILLITSCAGTRNYKATDYATACVFTNEKNATHRCLPIDTYQNKMKYHSMRDSEMRKMPTMSDVMD